MRDYAKCYGFKYDLLDKGSVLHINWPHSFILKREKSYECYDIAVEVAKEINGKVAEVDVKGSLANLFESHFVAYANGVIDKTPVFDRPGISYEVVEIFEPKERHQVEISFLDRVVYDYDRENDVLTGILLDPIEESVFLSVINIKNDERATYGVWLGTYERITNNTFPLAEEKIESEVENLERIVENVFSKATIL